MDHPETPTPGYRRTTHSTQPIRSTRLFNLGGSSPASTLLSDWTPRVSSNTQNTTAPTSQNRVEDTNPSAEHVDAPRPRLYRPGAFSLGTPFDRDLAGASSIQARPIAGGGSGTNVSVMSHGSECPLIVDRAHKYLVDRVAAQCPQRIPRLVLVKLRWHQAVRRLLEIALCNVQLYKDSVRGTATTSTTAGICTTRISIIWILIVR